MCLLLLYLFTAPPVSHNNVQARVLYLTYYERMFNHLLVCQSLLNLSYLNHCTKIRFFIVRGFFWAFWCNLL